jgi:CMP-N-acetylneuraminic acid synthetase
VAAVVEKLAVEGWDAVWTVSPTNLQYHPLKALVLEADGRMDCFDPAGAEIVARQQLSPTYHRNGAAYAISRECLVDQRSIKGLRTAAVVIEEPLVNIDGLEDLVRAEQFLAEKRADLGGLRF